MNMTISFPTDVLEKVSRLANIDFDFTRKFFNTFANFCVEQKWEYVAGLVSENNNEIYSQKLYDLAKKFINKHSRSQSERNQILREVSSIIHQHNIDVVLPDVDISYAGTIILEIACALGIESEYRKNCPIPVLCRVL